MEPLVGIPNGQKQPIRNPDEAESACTGSPDKYGDSFSRMVQNKLLDLGLQFRWDVERGTSYVDR